MRRAVVTLALATAALVGLAGCRTPGGAVDRTMRVEFETSDSGAARQVVIAQCGHLPGITVSPTAQGDPNVILDWTHASSAQYAAMANCLSNLEATQPGLQIRALVPDDGTDA